MTNATDCSFVQSAWTILKAVLWESAAKICQDFYISGNLTVYYNEQQLIALANECKLEIENLCTSD